jgi:hypothetical protein
MSNSKQENTVLDGIWAPWPAECILMIWLLLVRYQKN